MLFLGGQIVWDFCFLSIDSCPRRAPYLVCHHEHHSKMYCKHPDSRRKKGVCVCVWVCVCSCVLVQCDDHTQGKLCLSGEKPSLSLSPCPLSFLHQRLNIFPDVNGFRCSMERKPVGLVWTVPICADLLGPVNRRKKNRPQQPVCL